MIKTETTIQHHGDSSFVGVTTDEPAVRKALLRFAREHPNACVIEARNEDGSIFAYLPASWVSITPPKHIFMESGRETGRLSVVQ